MAWLSLDPTDNEPSSFWTYVVTALQANVPSLGAEVLELISSAPLPTDLVLTTLVNELAAAPHPVWLVLDDYHLIENPEIRAGLTFLLEHLPPQAHVLLSTRADPDLPVARWRVRGELVEIRAADLRFTSAEADAYLNVVTGLDLAAADIAVLEERTEGWIAALQLAALSLQGNADASGFIARFAGDDRYLVDYLIEEVLAHQPDAVRELLVAVSGSRPAQRTAVRRRHRTHGRQPDDHDSGAGQPVHRPAGRSPGVVPLPPPVRRCAAGAAAQRATGAGPVAAPARQPVVRAARPDRGVDPARTGGAGLRPGGPADRAGRFGDPASPAGSADARLAEGAARRRGPAQPGAQHVLRIHADGRGRPERGRAVAG